MGTSPSADLIAAYCDHQRMRDRSKRTIDFRRWLLTKADRDLPYGLDQVAEDELEAWLYRDDLTPNAKAVYYDSLNTFYAWGVGRGIFPYNPLADLPRPKERRGRPRPITDQQLQQVLAEAAEPYRLWALIAAYLGARCCEISALERDHVGPEVTWLHGKGGKEGYVATHPDVYAAVSRLDPGWVARTAEGIRASAHYVSSMSSAHFTRLGMPGVTMHRFRHWYGTGVRRASDLRTAQEALRHEDPKTTAIYTAVDLDEMSVAVRALPRLSPGAGVSAAAGDPVGVGPGSPPPTGVPGPAADPWGRGRR